MNTPDGTWDGDAAFGDSKSNELVGTRKDAAAFVGDGGSESADASLPSRGLRSSRCEGSQSRLCVSSDGGGDVNEKTESAALNVGACCELRLLPKRNLPRSGDLFLPLSAMSV